MQIYEIVLGVILFLMASAVILCITAQGRSEKAGVFMGGTQMRGKRAYRTGNDDAHADSGDGLRRRRGDPAAGHSGGAHIRKGGVQCE